MPFTTTFATLSARGFGLFGKKKVLTTVTFPSGTTTWTAPSSVGTLVSAVGQGASGGPGFFETGSYAYPYLRIDFPTATYPNPPPNPTVADSCTYAIRDYINSYSGLQYIGGVPFSPVIRINRSEANGSWQYTDSTPFTTYPTEWTGGGWIVGGTAVAENDAPVPFLERWLVRYTYYSFPYTGASTTAFGLTFPGGNEGPASPTTYTNVTITPGATYTIVNNGSLTIQYYV